MAPAKRSRRRKTPGKTSRKPISADNSSKSDAGSSVAESNDVDSKQMTEAFPDPSAVSQQVGNVLDPRNTNGIQQRYPSEQQCPTTDQCYQPDQRYPSNQRDQHYPTDQRYPSEQRYPPDQRYPSDQRYLPDQRYPTDQRYPSNQRDQHYPTDQRYI